MWLSGNAYQSPGIKPPGTVQSTKTPAVDFDVPIQYWSSHMSVVEFQRQIPKILSGIVELIFKPGSPMYIVSPLCTSRAITGIIISDSRRTKTAIAPKYPFIMWKYLT